MRRCIGLVVVGALVVPASAFGKQGAMFSPELFSFPSGVATRVQLYVLPVYRGTQEIGRMEGQPVYGPTQETVPAPRVGSMPVVSLREVGGPGVLRFAGSPLDRDFSSMVRIKPPPSNVQRRWVVSVRAGGRVYPDLIDPPPTTMPNLPIAPVAARLHQSASTRRRDDQRWLAFVGLVACLLSCTAVVLRRRSDSARSRPRRQRGLAR